jgi:hypothetical protein
MPRASVGVATPRSSGRLGGLPAAHLRRQPGRQTAATAPATRPRTTLAPDAPVWSCGRLKLVTWMTLAGHIGPTFSSRAPSVGQTLRAACRYTEFADDC